MGSSNFIGYINSPMSWDSINLMYESNNVSFIKCELYGDFVLSLFTIIFDTYMGDDLTNSENRVLHFKWCWNKNVDNFTKEGISINHIKLYKYFLKYIIEFYYNSDKSGPTNTEQIIISIWKDIFKYEKQKK